MNVQTSKGKVNLTNDEMDDVIFSMIYHKYFHHRTPGASKMVLISKLAQCCGITISPEIEEPFEKMIDQEKSYAILDSQG